MPTYEYACTGCGTHLEVVQRFGDEPLRECGVCGGTLRKVFHPAGIVFKGSGFYATDSRAASKGPARKEEPSKAGASGDAAKTGASKDPGSGSSSKADWSAGESSKAGPSSPKEKSA